MITATTTIELPQELYERAEQTAKRRGMTTAEFLAEAVSNHAEPDPTTRARRIAAAIELSALHEENLRIMNLIEEAFDPEMAKERLAQEAAA